MASSLNIIIMDPGSENVGWSPGYTGEASDEVTSQPGKQKCVLYSLIYQNEKIFSH